MVLASKQSALVREIGQRAYERRKQLRLTQEQVAERAGLSQHFIACIENGTKGLGEESIVGLCKGLQVSTDYLLLGRVTDEDRNRLVELMQPLNEAQLMGLEELIRVYTKLCGYAE